MRALLPNIHALLGTLTLSLGLVSLTACTTDHKDPADPPEVNTYNAYIKHGDELSVNSSIYHYLIKNDTLSTYKIADFTPAESGFENAIFLNTDAQKQGFEYIAYVIESPENKHTIKLFDLDKENKGKHYSLATINANLCGISSKVIPSEHAFTFKRASNISTKDKPEVILQLSESNTCDEPHYFEKIDFSNILDDNSRNDTNFEQSMVKGNDNTQALVINYNSGQTLASEESQGDEELQGDYGYVIYKEEFSQLSFIYSEIDDSNTIQSKSWSTEIPEAEPFFAQQVSSNYVLFQLGQKLYVILTSVLFDIASSDNTSQPAQARIDKLFEQPTMELPPSYNAVITTNEPIQTSSFVVNAGNQLFLYADGSFKEIRNNQNDSEDTLLTFLLNENNDTLVLAEEAGQTDRLSIISATGDQNFSMDAEEISIAINNNIFYANSHNPDLGTGPQAHLLAKEDSNFKATSFDNSLLLHIHDMTSEHDLALLISSEPEKNVSGTRQLTGSYLYKFDGSRDNGRALAQSSRKNENGKTEYRSVDFSYGIFNQLTDISFYNGIIVNDYYGLLNIQANTSVDGIKQHAEFSFVFQSEQETPDPDIEDQSLSLLLVDGI